MLNAETKRRINACRDILVGKVTDPKAQVEQITIALMYKFMNDLDHEVLDMGGTSSFFAGDFAAYSWDRITDSRLGGEERIRLYAEGIEKVVTNPGVPELFRQIFRNAYLPYRDPETFNLFSREISGFRYEHSEDLGDAFEYLLSVMQSQGDAGQFRTPRHIIDFMVEVVKPQPGERILDPACGTAGFLISAFKHIIREHPQLTPAQLEALHSDVEGQDISPDMVRLSRVNLYLHQFADPRIIEYDTLTSVDRWGHRYDVILANPPFMTPKGGIRPHRKFSLESNRSEVLFVDYIAEHLMAEGRAAVIVPEGIIFQSGKAYKALRRLLVENSLWAVVSLPAGVFNPYSGVKTSILFLDRGLSAKGGPVLFAQVKADGFDLGAQRRTVAANDLPGTLALLDDAHGRLKRGEVPKDFREGLEGHALAHLFVPREVLLAEADTNLSGERYRPRVAVGAQKWPRVKLGEVCESLSGGTPSKAVPQYWSGNIPWVSPKDMKTSVIDDTEDHISTEAIDGSATKLVPKDTLLVVVRSGILSHSLPLALAGRDVAFNQDIKAFTTKPQILPHYLYSVLRAKESEIMDGGIKRGGTVHSFHSDYLNNLEIPLPPLSVQQELVAEVARYQAVIDGAQQVVDNWKPTFAVDPEWPVVKLGEVCEIQRGKFSHRPRNEPKFFGGAYPFIQTGDVVKAEGGPVGYTQTLNGDGLSVSKLFKPTIVLVTIAANIGDTAILDYEACFADSVVGLIPSDRVSPHFLELAVRSKKQYLNDIAPQAAQKNINNEILRALDISLPPLEVQEAIVARIEEESALVDANKKLIEHMKARIDEIMARVWQ